MVTKATTGSKSAPAKMCFTGTRTMTGSRAIWVGTWSSEAPETTSCAERGTAHRTNDGARDVIDCGECTDSGIYTPGVDEITNCKSLNPPEPE